VAGSTNDAVRGNRRVLRFLLNLGRRRSVHARSMDTDRH